MKASTRRKGLPARSQNKTTGRQRRLGRLSDSPDSGMEPPCCLFRMLHSCGLTGGSRGGRPWGSGRSGLRARLPPGSPELCGRNKPRRSHSPRVVGITEQEMTKAALFYAVLRRLTLPAPCGCEGSPESGTLGLPFIYPCWHVRALTRGAHNGEGSIRILPQRTETN